jgi:hypothetical protein
VKYHKKNFKKIKEAMRKFNLPDSSGSNKSGEGEMIAQLKKRFYNKKRELKYYNCYASSNKLSVMKIQEAGHNQHDPLKVYWSRKQLYHALFYPISWIFHILQFLH